MRINTVDCSPKGIFSDPEEKYLKYEQLFKHSPELIIITDERLRVTNVNNAAPHLLGNSIKALLEEQRLDFIHPDDRCVLFRNIVRAKQQQDPLLFELRYKHQTGEYLDLSISLVWDGKFKSFYAIVRDISLTKKAELEMKKALELEKGSLELRSNFVSMASHQFKTPLTTIQSSVELAEIFLHRNKPEAITAHLEKIKKEVFKMSFLVTNVMIMAKNEESKIRFNPERADIVKFISDLLSGERSLQSFDLNKVKVNEFGERRQLFFDQSLMYNIIINLLSNAIKYSGGQQSPEINIFFEPKEIVIEIVDYGIGIPENEVPKLFESFYRASNAYQIEGSGLGLVVVKEFVEKQNGTISVRTKLNKGTTFSIAFNDHE